MVVAGIAVRNRNPVLIRTTAISTALRLKTSIKSGSADRIVLPPPVSKIPIGATGRYEIIARIGQMPEDMIVNLGHPNRKSTSRVR
jgi:hypothetical protein